MGTNAKVSLGSLGGVTEATAEDIDIDTEDLYFEGERLIDARAGEIAREITRRHGLQGGRTRKSDAARASVQKAVRLTPGQAARLSRAAKDRGIPESEVLREALESYLRDGAG